ncbi:hypothetical protein QRW16_002812 [Listeria monocytogenes]|nr:hypothetical protein [Listeria monocytogenes]
MDASELFDRLKVINRRGIHTLISSSNGVECSTKNLEDVIYFIELVAEQQQPDFPEAFHENVAVSDTKANLLQEVLHHVSDNLRTVLAFVKGNSLLDLLYIKQLIFLKDGLHTITLHIKDLPKLKGNLHYLENIFLAAPTSMIDWSKSIDSVEDYQAILPHSKEVQDFQQILTVYTKDAC